MRLFDISNEDKIICLFNDKSICKELSTILRHYLIII
jgi:hypothetical protein